MASGRSIHTWVYGMMASRSLKSTTAQDLEDHLLERDSLRRLASLVTIASTFHGRFSKLVAKDLDFSVPALALFGLCWTSKKSSI